MIAVCSLVVILIGIIFFLFTHYKVVNIEVDGNHHYTDEEMKNMVLTGGFLDNSLYLKMKYKNKTIDNIPFVETMDIEVVSADSIKITVYEKVLAGCVKYLGNYMYFDREGIVVESSPNATEGVAEITGLHFNHVMLYEQLPVKKDEVFQEILELTQLMDKYKIVADKIYFDPDLNVTLYFEGAKVLIGSKKNIDEKIMQLAVIVPTIRGKSGVLDMREYETGTQTLTFVPE